MNSRSLVSIAVLAMASVSLATGCPGEDKKGPAKGTPTAKATTKAAPTGKATAAPKPAGGEKFGKGSIKGAVTFTGTAPEMKVPKKRKEAELCKDTQVKYNAVIVNDGKLQDVFVGIADEQLSGEYSADKAAEVDQKDCMYAPRIQGVLVDQDIAIKNSDATLHNVNGGRGAETLFNTAQPKGAPVLKKSFEETGIYRVKCDVHSWMRAFIITSDNPFNAVSGADGTFSIAKVPDGKYKVVAWHSQFGKKEKEIEVKGGAAVDLNFEFSDKDAAPAENQGELKDLF